MSKKHFEALARALANSKPAKKGAAMDQWRRDVEAIADVCQSQNGMFRRETFLDACGYESE